jgi:hypothetical protein
MPNWFNLAWQNIQAMLVVLKIDWIVMKCFPRSPFAIRFFVASLLERAVKLQN